MSDVFISYSRLDKEFVAHLRDSLLAKEQEVWIDWQDIPPSQSWWDEIQKGIAKANNVVLILSPNSMGSVICHMEIEYARQLKKRIIPVLHAPYERDASVTEMQNRLAKPEEFTTREIWGSRQPQSMYDANDGELKHINFFFFSDNDDFKEKFEALFEIIRTDYAYKEQHTTFLLRANEWNRRGRDVSFLLLDTELNQAETWINSSPGKLPPPTDLQHDYIQASEKRTRQLHNIRRASIIGSIAAVVALIFAVGASLVGLQATNSANAASTREGAANTQVADANGQLTAVPPTLTLVNQQVVAAQGQANAASTQVADANGQLTAVPPTLTLVNQQVVVAQGQANDASTQVANAQATATQIPPTLTQAAVVQGITVNFANVMFNVDNPKEQIAQLNKIVETYPDQAISYEARGAYYDKSGQKDLALQDYNKALELDPSDTDTYALRASIRSDQGDLEGAMTDYSQAIALDPKNSNAYANRGTARLNSGDSEGALADINQAISLDPQIPNYYGYRGDVYHAMGEYDKAIADYTQAISLDPQSGEFYYGRGSVYGETGDYQKALDDFNQAIAANPQYDPAYYNRAAVRSYLDDSQGALDDLNQAIALDSQNPDYFNSRGTVRYNLYDFEGAAADFTQAIDLNSTDMDYYVSRAETYLTLYANEPDSDKSMIYLQEMVSDYQTAQSMGYEIPADTQEILDGAEALLATPTSTP